MRTRPGPITATLPGFRKWFWVRQKGLAELDCLASKGSDRRPGSCLQVQQLMNFDLDSQTRRELGYQLIDVVDGFFGSLPDRPVQRPAENRVYPPHDSLLPETGEDPVKVMDEVCRE